MPANNTGFYIMLILLIVIFESIGQYHIKKSKLHDSLVFFFIAILCYVVVCLLLKKCYEFKGMGITNFIWSVLSIITVLMVGMLAFDENITKIDIIGIMLAVSGLYLIFVVEHPK